MRAATACTSLRSYCPRPNVILFPYVGWACPTLADMESVTASAAPFKMSMTRAVLDSALSQHGYVSNRERPRGSDGQPLPLNATPPIANSASASSRPFVGASEGYSGQLADGYVVVEYDVPCDPGSSIKTVMFYYPANLLLRVADGFKLHELCAAPVVELLPQLAQLEPNLYESFQFYYSDSLGLLLNDARRPRDEQQQDAVQMSVDDAGVDEWGFPYRADGISRRFFWVGLIRTRLERDDDWTLVQL
jgi:hypothetical protein